MSPPGPTRNVAMQIKVTLLRVTKPPVWRRLQVRADTRLDRLHEILQAALGWQNYHLHVFSVGAREFGDPDPELSFSDEREVALGELVDRGSRFRYTYDFGDDWEYEILVEDVLESDQGASYPNLVAAKGVCPPEDSGGPYGYAHLREVLAEPSHEEHEAMLEWLGLNDASDFDPAAVPTEEIERELALIAAGG